MAPNIQHNLHLLSAGPRSIAHLNVKIAPGAVAKDYQRSTPVADSASYWRWESPKDLFSAEHVVATTVRSATTSTTSVTTQHCDTTNDSYWTEASRSTPADYWDERSSSNKSCAAEANYWSEAQAPRHFGESQQSLSYWDEVNHHAQKSAGSPSSPADDYWREEQSPERHYWDWTSSQATSRDRYWVM
jgi:hypothetical protein